MAPTNRTDRRNRTDRHATDATTLEYTKKAHDPHPFARGTSWAFFVHRATEGTGLGVAGLVGSRPRRYGTTTWSACQGGDLGPLDQVLKRWSTGPRKWRTIRGKVLSTLPRMVRLCQLNICSVLSRHDSTFGPN